MTLGEFVQQHYTSHVRARLRSWKHQMWRLRRHFGWLYNTELEAIDPARMDKWFADRVASVSPSTANRDYRVLSACVSHAIRIRVARANPLQSVRPVKFEADRRELYLSVHELRRMRAILDRWGKHDPARAMVLVTINTGLRWGELAKSDWSWIDGRRKAITVQASATKSKRTRVVSLNREAWDALKQYRVAIGATHQRNGLIFPSRKPGVIRTRPPRKWVAMKHAIGRPDLRWHDLRHHCASQLAMAGVPLATIREVLGHQTINTTLIYTHLSPEHHRDAMEKISGL